MYLPSFSTAGESIGANAPQYAVAIASVRFPQPSSLRLPPSPISFLFSLLLLLSAHSFASVVMFCRSSLYLVVLESGGCGMWVGGLGFLTHDQ